MHRARILWFATAGVLAAAGVVLAVVAASSGGSGWTMHSAAAAARTEPTRSPDSTKASRLSPAEQKLIGSLHFVNPSSCDGLPDEETGGVLAKVVCDPDVSGADAPENVFVYQVADDTALNKVATDLYGASPDFSNCADAPASSTWSKDGGPTIGNLYCGLGETSGSPIFAWSYIDDNVFVHVQAGKQKPHADLYKWWQSVDVDLG